MAALFELLRSTGFYIAAQVHSHPNNAFHSKADDKWAIIRHENALSFVIPFFGAGLTIESFVQKVAVFRLAPNNDWVAVPNSEKNRYYEVVV
jgi:hypothetical protein